MTDPSSDPSDRQALASASVRPSGAHAGLLAAMENWLRRRMRRNGDDHVRDAIEDLIEGGDETEVPIGRDERQLLSNVLQLRDSTVEDVMVPRVDIVGVEVDASLAGVIEAFNKAGHSRLVVYRGGLDDALGMVHIKDILAWRGRDGEFRLIDIVRRTLFVAPSMGVLELLLEMRVGRAHMALVVDEYGGIDGLVTIEGLVEEIVGEFESERTRNTDPRLDVLDDGSLMVDGRVEIEAFEHHVGPVLTDAEREDIDTVGGLVAAVAGRVPIRGELIRHPSGLEFQILEADPRTVKRLKVLRIPSPPVIRRPVAPFGTAGSGAASGAEGAPPDASDR